jgi:hypothetical protein
MEIPKARSLKSNLLTAKRHKTSFSGISAASIPREPATIMRSSRHLDRSDAFSDGNFRSKRAEKPAAFPHCLLSEFFRGSFSISPQAAHFQGCCVAVVGGFCLDHRASEQQSMQEGDRKAAKDD